jgi:hypothetical protein
MKRANVDAVEEDTVNNKRLCLSRSEIKQQKKEEQQFKALNRVARELLASLRAELIDKRGLKDLYLDLGLVRDAQLDDIFGPFGDIDFGSAEGEYPQSHAAVVWCGIVKYGNLNISIT